MWDLVGLFAGLLALSSVVLFVKRPGGFSSFGVALSLFLFLLHGVRMQTGVDATPDWASVMPDAFLVSLVTFAFLGGISWLHGISRKHKERVAARRPLP